MSARSRSLGIGIVAIALLATSNTGASAQASRSARPPQIQPEARVDFVYSRAPAAHIGGGFSVPAGTYVRLGLVGGAGQSWHNGTSGAAARVDGVVRFVVDPLRESRWAPYAAGGLGAIYDHSEDWRAVLIGALGIEGPASGNIVPAVEVGFGGGARLGVVIRRAMAGRR